MVIIAPMAVLFGCSFSFFSHNRLFAATGKKRTTAAPAGRHRCYSHFFLTVRIVCFYTRVRSNPVSVAICLSRFNNTSSSYLWAYQQQRAIARISTFAGINNSIFAAACHRSVLLPARLQGTSDCSRVFAGNCHQPTTGPRAAP